MAATATPSVMRTRSRILVASADPLFRDRVKRNPAYADVTSEEAVGGAHALAKLLQWPCDGVLLDRNLPDLDAEEVADQIRKQYPQIEVELVDSEVVVIEVQPKGNEAEVLDEVTAAAVEEGVAACEVVAGDVESGATQSASTAGWEAERRECCEARREITPLPGMIGSSGPMKRVYRIMTNVVDVYINYLRRKVDSGYERALIRTVRGVGYQIGGVAPVARSAAASSSSSVTTVVS